MNHKTEDTRATDYVLGELQGIRLVAFEKELERSESLRAEVDAIRETIEAVKTELTGDSTCVNTASLNHIQNAIRQTDDTSADDTSANVRLAGRHDRSRNWMVGLVAAACLLLIGWLALPARQMALTTSTTERSASYDQMLVEHEMYEYEDEAASEDGGGGGGGSYASSSRRTPTRRNSQPPATTRAAIKTSMQPSESVDAYMDEMKAPSATSANGGIPFPKPQVRSKPQGASIAKSRSNSKNSNEGLEIDFRSIDARNAELAAQAEAARRQRVSAMESMDAAEEIDADAIIFDADAGATTARKPSRRELRRQQMMGESNGHMFAEPFGAADEETISVPGSYSAYIEEDYGEEMEESEDMFGSNVSLGLDGTNGLPESEAKHRQLQTQHERLVSSLGAGHPTVKNLKRELELFRHEVSRGDRFARIHDNPFRKVDDSPLSTFSIDVDTASYSKVRMYLAQHNSLPSPDAVRIEELINYFDYDYKPPTDEHPFASAMEVATCPWNRKHRLARIALKGKVIEEQRPSSNLVFLLDVSGSMNQPQKLPLVVAGMKMLTEQLTENDSVAIVVYAGAAGMVLDSTTGDQRQTILDALDRLRAGGSTNGGQGIQLAYQLARDNFIVGGTNRVILCSDGDFNVGVSGTNELVRLAQREAKSNVFLSVLGFGIGNHNDEMMEEVSNKANGNYAFIDNETEARKVLVDQIGGTLVTIAKDVKVQIEFNPAEVAAYRLIGYENRILAAKDFDDDKKDAGEIGAGHTVTALYELVPAKGAGGEEAGEVSGLRYQKKTTLSEDATNGELLTLKLRYKPPTGSKSRLLTFPIRDEKKQFAETDADFQFAASVAGFGMLLRGSPYRGDATFATIQEIAESSVGEDTAGYRAEFVKMVAKARALLGE